MAFEAVGHEVLRSVVSPQLLTAALAQANELVKDFKAQKAPKNLLLHEERISATGVVAPTRIERFTEFPGALQEVCSAVTSMTEKVTERKLIILKDKLNFKYPGAGFFLPHQDTPAFQPFGSWHVSVLVPLTAFTEDNGALEVSDRIPLRPIESLAGLDYRPVLMEAGDILVFDGFVPHRSGANITRKPRAGIYLTFVDASVGNQREAYYATKAEALTPEKGMSLNQIDFTGNLVLPAPPKSPPPRL
jgi:ectoine hydroxylase-related dioxygenase (phytanoyl-CoA dioxygenase family)